MARTSLSLLLASLPLLIASAAHADTVSAEAAKGACSTAGVVGLSDQLVKVQMCLSPGTFVAFTPHAGVTLTSSSIHPYLLESSKAALWDAASHIPLSVNSAFRTLADQYVLYYSHACGLAAMPGNSNHETGRAVDLENWSAATSAMEAAGCTHTYPSSDPVHFDCPGSDHRADSIKAFQHLWNVNNPGDLLVEDGSYGPATESRLAKSPAGGFPDPADCGAPPVTPDWGAAFVGQSFPLAPTPLDLSAGEVVDGWIELKNIGTKAWDGKTFLATTEKRDRSSPFADSSWPAANRPAMLGGVVSPGGTHKFMFKLRAPAKVGDYVEHYGVVEEGVAWFSDPGQGGPADSLLQVHVVVSAPKPGDAGVGDADAAGDDSGVIDPDGGAILDDGGGPIGDGSSDIASDGAASGCKCGAPSRSSTPRGAWAVVALGALLLRSRRRG